MSSARVATHFTGRASLQREVARQQILGRDAALGAKPSAHVGGDHPDLVRWDAQRAGQVGPNAVRRLAGDPQRETETPAVVAGHRDDPARLERNRSHSGTVDPQLHDRVGFLEGAIDIPALTRQRIAEVAAEARMDQRRARLERGFGGGHRGLRLVLDLDEVGGVARRAARLGDDRDDRHADRRDMTAGQRRVRWDLDEGQRNTLARCPHPRGPRW